MIDKIKQNADAIVILSIMTVLALTFMTPFILSVFNESSPEVIRSMDSVASSDLALAGTIYNHESGLMAYLWALLPFLLIGGGIFTILVIMKFYYIK